MPRVQSQVFQNRGSVTIYWQPLDQGLAPPVNDDVGEDPSTTMLEMYFKKKRGACKL